MERLTMKAWELMYRLQGYSCGDDVLLRDKDGTNHDVAGVEFVEGNANEHGQVILVCGDMDEGE